MKEGKIQKGLNESASKGLKSLAVLIDPDKINGLKQLATLISLCNASGVQYILVGGSLVMSDKFEATIRTIKELTTLPVVIFPGNNTHLYAMADGILFLSLISGRNPEFLIGQQVVAAPALKKSGIEILPTGYILVGNSAETTVAYMSNTTPIPLAKSDIAVATAMAGEMLGLMTMYLDAGSGARFPVPSQMIHEVKKSIGVPLIVGGGIDTPSKGSEALIAGADVLVIGNGTEKRHGLITEMAELVAGYNEELNVH